LPAAYSAVIASSFTNVLVSIEEGRRSASYCRYRLAVSRTQDLIL
jgi:hypothetical protein